MSASKKYFTKGSKILLVGGTGYLGSLLYNVLLEQGYHKVIIGTSSKVKRDHHIYLDLLDNQCVESIREMGFEFVFNLSGQISNPISQCLLLNTKGIENLLKICGDSSVLIHFSTVNLYGTGQNFNEDSICSPETPYSVLKLVAETIIEAKAKKEHYTIIRISNLYGGNQPKGIFAYLKNSALNLNPSIHFNNDGNMIRNYLHVEDAARGIIKFCENSGWEKRGLVNYVGKDALDIPGLVSMFEREFNVKFKVLYAPQKAWENSIGISDQNFREISTYIDTISLEHYIKNLALDAYK